jgi:hypothetical protein
MPSDIEIAQKATMKRIAQVAKEKLGISDDHLEPYGHYKAKVSLPFLETLKGKPDGKLILVTAISPTPAGEGKTTTTVGLGDALNHIGKKAMICLREPSLGPVFGVKGGAAGGGKTDLACGKSLTRHRKIGIFRQNGTELTGVVDRFTDLLKTRNGYNGQQNIWRTSRADGVRIQIEFGSFPNLGDEKKYQGRPHDLLVFDEAANMREEQVRFLLGWLRTTVPNQPCQALMTFNPPTTAEGRWIIKYFGVIRLIHLRFGMNSKNG